MNASEIRECLDLDILHCSWVDGLGRKVLLRKRALCEVKTHLQAIVERDISRTSQRLGRHLVDMISNGNDDEKFVFTDISKVLPIPVFSSITPKTPIPFLLHVMLMLGEYDTELDLKMQPTMRESFAKVKLIDNSVDDEEAMKRETNQLLVKIIQEVFAVQPISLRRLDIFIVTTKQLLEAVLVNNEIPITDLPPCILTQMLDSKDEELNRFWEEKQNDQLTSIYRTMPEGMDLPEREDVLSCTKDSPLEWDPLTSFTQYDGQSQQSFQEQSMAVRVACRSIRKYSMQFGPATTVYTKGTIVHGAPGSGKSHVSLFNCLYAMTLGLRVMATALMGVRGNALGGVHLHRLFGLTVRKRGNPYRLAELALDKLHRKSNLKYLHVLLTMDVLLIDECGQLSAQQISILDIILRIARNSKLPFGGVHIMGTMDHAQLGSIEGWPFLLSSHVITDFTLIQLRCSVRAHGDPEFQRIQNITRMPPRILLQDPDLEREFKSLVADNMTFARDWNDAAITPDVQRMYARRMPAYEAASEFVASCERMFQNNGTVHTVSKAVDLQRTADTRAEYVPAYSSFMTAALNHGLKEPEKLLFWHGAQFEATLNGDGFNQSQLLIMLDVPTQEVISMKAPIHLLAAPPTVTSIDTSERVPSLDELLDDGWKQVVVRHSPEQPVTCQGTVGCRQQYSLRHIGSSTIDKQMGNTIDGRCAFECTAHCSAWNKRQVVVTLSRTHTASDVIIVGLKDEAIDRLWQLITTSTQWSEYEDMILERLSIRGDGANHQGPQRPLEYAESFPYRTCDIALPSAPAVYMLVSVRDFDRDYVGQTTELAERFCQHNSGQGAIETADPYYQPWCMGAYICGLSHMDKMGREELERRWKIFNGLAIREGRRDIESRIEQGRRVVEQHNSMCLEEERIQLVVTIKRQ